MDILDSLIASRKLSSITQKKLAPKLGVNAITLGRYESGEREIPASVLIKYAEFMDFEIRLLKK